MFFCFVFPIMIGLPLDPATAFSIQEHTPWMRMAASAPMLADALYREARPRLEGLGTALELIVANKFHSRMGGAHRLRRPATEPERTRRQRKSRSCSATGDDEARVVAPCRDVNR